MMIFFVHDIASFFLGSFTVLLLIVTPCSTLSLDEYTAWMEDHVKLIANTSVQNAQNCDLVKSCSSEGPNCSRQQCGRALEDTETLDCIIVPNNTDCSTPHAGTCQNMSVSTLRSYVRFPPGIMAFDSSTPPYIRNTVCTQRMLDPVFKTIWNSTKYQKAWIYFGSADGVQRVFPGREWNGTDHCNNYDPRIRPWYKGVTSIEKNIVILLDIGTSMDTSDYVAVADTKIDIAIKIATNLLDTLSSSDQVSLLKFDPSGAYVIGNLTLQDDLTSSNVSALKSMINQVTASFLPGPSNLSSGLSKAMEVVGEESTNLKKIIMVLTNGNVNVDEKIANMLVANNVSLFIYILDTIKISNYDALAGLSSSTNGYIVNVTTTDYPGENPLWAIRSYFDVMAQLWVQANNGSTSFAHVYNDSDGFGLVTTFASAAIDDEGHLIGVAGIDALITELVKEFPSVINMPSSGSLQARNVSPTTQIKPFQTCDVESSTLDGLCVQGNKGYLDLLCCGMCLANYSESPLELSESPSKPGSSHSLSWRVVLGIVCGGIVVISLFLLFIYCCIFPKFKQCSKSKSKVTNESPPPSRNAEEWSRQL